MIMVRTIAALIAAATAMTSTVCAQSSKTLTARELFYAPAKPAPAAKAQPAKPPQRVASNKPPSAKPTANKAPAPQVARIQSRRAAVTPSGVAVIPAAYGGGRPLGLRYSLLRKSGGDKYEEVDAGTVFRFRRPHSRQRRVERHRLPLHRQRDPAARGS